MRAEFEYVVCDENQKQKQKQRSKEILPLT